MKFRNGSELFQMHGGHFTILQLWFGKRVFDIDYYPQHTFHFWCHSNGAVKGKDNCLDLNLHILAFSFRIPITGIVATKRERKKLDIMKIRICKDEQF